MTLGIITILVVILISAVILTIGINTQTQVRGKGNVSIRLTKGHIRIKGTVNSITVNGKKIL